MKDANDLYSARITTPFINPKTKIHRLPGKNLTDSEAMDQVNKIMVAEIKEGKCIAAMGLGDNEMYVTKDTLELIKATPLPQKKH